MTSTQPNKSPSPNTTAERSTEIKEMTHSLLPFLTTSLKDFTSSSSAFRIIYTHPPTRLPPPSALPLRTLYVLDSSFNPPSRAHAWIAKNAVLSELSSARDGGGDTSPWEGKRLLLLLATQNADKAAKPAAFEDRLGMMVLMARQLFLDFLDAENARVSSVANSNVDDRGGGGGRGGGGLGFFAIDVGVTTNPFFVDKASAIEESGVYGEKGRFEQVHLTGFDTLTRIFDKKYYGEDGLGVLGGFLERGRIRAVVRPDVGGLGKAEAEGQREWVEGVRNGEREEEGVRGEWAERIDLVEDEEGEVKGVSSTRVREGVKSGEWGVVEELVGKDVKEWIRERELYLDEDGKG